MNKIYDEYFAIDENTKITEKVLYTRVAVSITLIVLCMVAMAFTAYAYFTANLESPVNRIESTEFDVRIDITHEYETTKVVEQEPSESEAEADEETPETEAEVSENVSIELEDVKVVVQEPYFRTAVLKEGINYVTVSYVGPAETGFCIVEIDGNDMITQQLGFDRMANNSFTSDITFSVEVDDDTLAYFYSHWGTSSDYDDFANGVLSGEQIYITDGLIIDFADEEDTVEEPAEEPEEDDSTDEPAEEPTVEEPTVEEPTAEEPIVEEPAVEEPTEEEPTEEEPIVEEPTEEEPTEEEPTEEEPTEDEPAEEEPTVEEPAEEEPIVEEPTEEEPTVEEPIVEEPIENIE